MTVASVFSLGDPGRRGLYDFVAGRRTRRVATRRPRRPGSPVPGRVPPRPDGRGRSPPGLVRPAERPDRARGRSAREALPALATEFNVNLPPRDYELAAQILARHGGGRTHRSGIERQLRGDRPRPSRQRRRRRGRAPRHAGSRARGQTTSKCSKRSSPSRGYEPFHDEQTASSGYGLAGSPTWPTTTARQSAV